MAKTLLKSYWDSGNLHFAQSVSGGSAYIQLDDAPILGGLVRGTIYCVDSINGLDTYNGLTWGSPFLTIAKAVATCSAGDTILIRGYGASTSVSTNRTNSFNEAVTCNKSGVSFIGIGPTTNDAIWTAPDTTAPCLTLTGTDCLVYGVRFCPPVANAAVSLSGAYQTRIVKCRFQGKTNSYYGILTDGNNANVRVEDCDFQYINTASNGYAIYGQTYTSGENSGWQIIGNRFDSNTNHISCRLRQSYVVGNIFGDYGYLAAGAGQVTTTLDIHGANVGANIVTQNHFCAAYAKSGLYGGTNDSWAGNYCTDRSHGSQVDATTGISILAPA